jgi:RIO-like serine/threonine protein kinase
MTVQGEPGPAVCQPLLSHRLQEDLSLRLDRLGQQSPRSFAQHRRQRIVELAGLAQNRNAAVRRHRRIAPLDVRAGRLPAPISRPLHTVITHCPP